MRNKQVSLPCYAYKGYTVACIASGPSLTHQQVNMCKKKGVKVIAINDSYKLAPWADILYACDNKWWEWHNYVSEFKGRKITHEQLDRWEKIKEGEILSDMPNPSLEIMVSDGKSVYDDRPLGHSQSLIKHGGNSGFQAICMALLMGASRVVLLGYDMKPKNGVSHWFGEHPNGKQSDSRYVEWLKEFPDLKKFADSRNQQIINCTPDTNLKCFKMMDINSL